MTIVNLPEAIAPDAIAPCVGRGHPVRGTVNSTVEGPGARDVRWLPRGSATGPVRSSA